MQGAPSASPPPPQPATTDGLWTTVVRTAFALEQHLDAWDVLVAHAAEPNPFFEPHALLSAWRHLAPPDGIEVVLVWAPHPLPGQPPHLAGLFPVVRKPRFKGLPLGVVSIWRHDYAYLGTPLVRAGVAREALAALFAWLRTHTDASLFEWRAIAADGAFRHALIDVLQCVRLDAFQDSCHTRAMFRPAETAEAYLTEAIPGKKRKELRRQERRLAELGKVTYDELAPGGDLEAWLDDFLALEQRGWKGRGGTALRDDKAAAEVFRGFARGANTRGRWMTLALRLDGKPIAMKCNLRGGRGAVAFKIAYDEAYARFSPGVLLEVEQIRRLHHPAAPQSMDSGAAADHPMIGHLWRHRVAIETLVTPTGRAPGMLTVAAMPLARWTSRTLRTALHRLRQRPT